MMGGLEAAQRGLEAAWKTQRAAQSGSEGYVMPILC